jgi:peptidoglycan hydrolase FlgJ
MTTAVDTTVAMTAYKAGLPTAPSPTTDPAVAKKVSQQFESVFITQFLGSMFDGISTDGPFGGGQGEAMFRSLLMDEYGKQVETQGGFGLSAAIQRELLKTQESVH